MAGPGQISATTRTPDWRHIFFLCGIEFYKIKVILGISIIMPNMQMDRLVTKFAKTSKVTHRNAVHSLALVAQADCAIRQLLKI
jgi:hypothetical protein